MITSTAKLNTHRDAFPLLLQDVVGKFQGFVCWQLLELFSGQLHQAQKNLSFMGMLMTTEKYCLFFLLPHFILHEEGFLRRHYCQKRTKCQGQDFRLINYIERSSRGSPWSPEAISHLFLTLSSSPEVPVRSSTVASCRLSCFLHLLTPPQRCCSPQLPPSWCPTLQVSTNRVTWGILFFSLRTTI